MLIALLQTDVMLVKETQSIFRSQRKLIEDRICCKEGEGIKSFIEFFKPAKSLLMQYLVPVCEVKKIQNYRFVLIDGDGSRDFDPIGQIDVTMGKLMGAKK